jgi:hypothetical protein
MRQLIKCLKAQTELLDVSEKQGHDPHDPHTSPELWVERN